MLDKRIQRASRVCFDYTGPGIGLGDYLVRKHGEWNPEQHKFGKIELCTFTAGFKREIFPRMRRAFEAPTKVRIPISIAVREDLHAMKQIVRGGEYSYSAPRTAEGHSDRCTGLALAWRATTSAAGKIVYRPVHVPGRGRHRIARSRTALI
jgi:phage FluMu gp28-like protein